MSSRAIARAVATRSSAVENVDGAAVTIPIGPGKDEHYCFTAGDYDEYGVLHRQRYTGYVRKVVTPTSTRNVAHAKVYVVCDGDAEGLELPLPLIDFVSGLRRGCGDGVDVGAIRHDVLGTSSLSSSGITIDGTRPRRARTVPPALLNGSDAESALRGALSRWRALDAAPALSYSERAAKRSRRGLAALGDFAAAIGDDRLPQGDAARAAADAALECIFEVESLCALDQRAQHLRADDGDGDVDEDDNMIDYNGTGYTRSLRGLDLSRPDTMHLSNELRAALRAGLDDVVVVPCVTRRSTVAAVALNAPQRVISMWNDDYKSKERFHALSAVAYSKAKVQLPGKRYVSDRGGASGPIVDVVHMSSELLASLSALGVAAPLDVGAAPMQQLSHDVRLVYTDKRRTGVDHAANGYFTFHGMTSKCSSSTRYGNPGTAADESMFVDAMVPSVAVARSRRELTKSVYRRLARTRQFAERFHGVLSPRETAWWRVLNGLALTPREMGLAVGSMPLDLRDTISQGKPTTYLTHGTGIFTEAFATAGAGHFDDDGKSATLCHGAVYSNVSTRDEWDAVMQLRRASGAAAEDDADGDVGSESA